ncbi:MAG: hypothetical protein KAR38_08535, partial [Calditrichia bacterium]|nr:hypothetical protein [Calditrichia bacterium]
MKIIKIVLFVIFISTPVIAQNNDIKFEHIAAIDGIQLNQVVSILQDSSGFMWFGTVTNGLVRYDGYKFIHYKNFLGDSIDVSSNVIMPLYEDRAGQIWV